MVALIIEASIYTAIAFSLWRRPRQVAGSTPIMLIAAIIAARTWINVLNEESWRDTIVFARLAIMSVCAAVLGRAQRCS